MATLAAVAFGGGDPGLLAVGQGVNVALQLQNTREAEAEADREAIAYMVRAGYDPAGMTRFFQRLVATYPTSGPDIPDYLYSHPAVKERVSASKVEMKRVDAPRDLIRYDPRLPLMQGRLARLLEPTVGGSGLHARPDFDRSVTDPLLEEAGFALEAGRTDEADLLLERAEQLEPADPRVALRRADIAEDRGDWATSADHLKRAFEIDPAGPLVLYRLGIAHRQQGSRTQAVFYLEQAAAAYRPGSAGRRRADLEIDRLTFPLLDDSGLHAEGSAEDRRSFGRGETIVWSGELADRYLPRNPKIEIEWLDPDGAVAHRELVRMNAFGNVTSRLDASLTRVGIWTVRVSTEDSPVDTYTFAIEESHGSPD
jgi:tetratricopeptide (TPR) repeat protein